jgi:hypothetical protein
MHAIVKRLRQMADDDLLALSEAIDMEVAHRLEIAEETPDSARRRAVMRQQSYRRVTGANATPVQVTGLGKHRRNRMAA